jgi:predicted DCC family thiol-disulfide oxidoreductase YuxK
LIQVFFDGKCGVCSKEIAQYKSLAPKNVFSWINIAVESKALNHRNITQAQGLLYLHVIDTENKLHIGVDAFAVIWKQLPKWWIIGYLIKAPLFNFVATLVYKFFAQKRFSSYEHCRISSTVLK